MAAPGGNPGLSPDDLEKCRRVLLSLKSDRYQKYNFVFLEPFDSSQTPGYFDVVSKKLDLKTVSSNLEAGEYKTKEEFLEDTELIFQNAIKYHTGRDATKWIVKYAKEMIKALKKERKNLDKRPSKILTKQKSQLKLKIGGTAAGGTAAVKKEEGADTAAAAAAAAAQEAPPPQGTEAAAPATTKPKLSLKLNKAGTKKKEEKEKTAAKAKPTQPKLKLKLSLNKKAETPTGDAAATTEGSEKASKTSVKISGPRGKELPKGVSPPAATATSTTKKSTAKGAKGTTKKAKAATTTNTTTTTTTKKTTTKKVKKTASPATAAAPAPPPVGPASMMSPARKIQCYKILSGLKRRKSKNINWFLLPISDKNIVQDYKSKIPNPICLSHIQNKLDKNEYQTVAHFVLDLRRIFGNCFRYNTSIKDRLRPVAGELLQTAEDLMVTFLVRGQKPGGNMNGELYPPILYCWELCIKVLNTLFNLTNPDDGQATALYFLHPVSFYFGGQLPPDYLSMVKKPMDFGTITSKYVL